jgi:hypothetical protein
MAKQEKWKLCPATKRPPRWVLDQTGCKSKAELKEKFKDGTTFTRSE